MITRAKCTLVALALAMSVGCSYPVNPATPPPPPATVLRVYHTSDTLPLVTQTGTPAYETTNNVQFDFERGNHLSLLGDLADGGSIYVFTHHLADSALDIWSAPLVRDGLVLIVHPENTLTSITIEQARRIYRGQSLRWSDFGGSDVPITVYSRELGAATRLEFERLVMGQQQTSPNAQVLSSSAQMLAQIAQDSTGIGYVPLSLLGQSANVQRLAVETVTPSRTTVADNSYPLRMTVYVIGYAEPTGAYRRYFLSIQSSDTQTALAPFYAPLPR